MSRLVLIFSFVLISFSLMQCSQEEPENTVSISFVSFGAKDLLSKVRGIKDNLALIREREYYYRLGEVYWLADSVIRKDDTVIVINTKYDTTMIATGIFTYLYYYAPGNYVPYEIFSKLKKAIALGEDSIAAKSYYSDIIQYYYTDHVENNKQFTSALDYYRFNMNCAIIFSYAFEKLGRLDDALETMRYYMVLYDPRVKITQRYLELCIKKYGCAEVKEEFEKAYATVHWNDGYKIKDWLYNIFGSEIRFPGTYKKTMGKKEFDQELMNEEYYPDCS